MDYEFFGDCSTTETDPVPEVTVHVQGLKEAESDIVTPDSKESAVGSQDKEGPPPPKRPRVTQVGDTVPFDTAVQEFAVMEEAKVKQGISRLTIPPGLVPLFTVKWESRLPKSRGMSGRGAEGKRKSVKANNTHFFDKRKTVSAATRERRRAGGHIGAVVKHGLAKLPDLKQGTFDPETGDFSGQYTLAQRVLSNIYEMEPADIDRSTAHATLMSDPQQAFDYGYSHPELHAWWKAQNSDHEDAGMIEGSSVAATKIGSAEPTNEDNAAKVPDKPESPDDTSNTVVESEEATIEVPDEPEMPPPEEPEGAADAVVEIGKATTGVSNLPAVVHLKHPTLGDSRANRWKTNVHHVYNAVLSRYGRVYFTCRACNKVIAGSEAAIAHAKTGSCKTSRDKLAQGLKCSVKPMTTITKWAVRIIRPEE